MSRKTNHGKPKLIGIIILFALFLILESAPIKIKVIVDNASVKATPEIGGKNLAGIQLNTILEAEEKADEWYKVMLEAEGIQITGYIHEMLVEVYTGEEIPEEGAETEAGAGKPQAEILAEIGIKLEESRSLIRQEKDFEKVINDLRPLIAKAFSITDSKRQKEIASEIYLWVGLAYAGDGNAYSALSEFRNMFEVGHDYAKEITRNIYDPEVVGLIELAEKQYLGHLTEYSLEIATEPKEAKIKIDGKDIGLSPEVYRTSSPKFTIEVEKEGFKPVKDEVFLTQAASRKDYTLERLVRPVEVKSIPPGAKVLLDGEDTNQVTDCQLPFVTFGPHRIHISKENYTEWEEQVEIEKGEIPVVISVILTGNNYSLMKKWGGPAAKLFKQPKGMTVDGENNFYVLDDGDPKVKKFDPEGKQLRGWGNQGREFKNLKMAADIAIDSEGFLYITDMKNHSVHKFSKQGKFVNKWGKEGTEADKFKTPLGIAADSNNNIYVADSENNRIKKYSAAGELIKTWGKRGNSDGDLIFPAAVATNQKDEVYVADRIRIQMFSADGEFISSWGKTGTADGEINKPMGIFIDQHGYVYVSDSNNNRVQKFDANGRFIAKWGAPGRGEGQMLFPYGIAVDSRGFVYVAERDSNRIQQFAVSN